MYVEKPKAKILAKILIKIGKNGGNEKYFLLAYKVIK